MNVYEAIMTRRTIRKFKQDPVSYEVLLKLADCARMAAYGANLQPLKFAIVNDDRVKEIYNYTKWAGYLPDYKMEEDERPTAYIAIFGDKKIKSNGDFGVDAGAAATTILLMAHELKLGACMLGAIQRNEITKLLNTDNRYDLLYLIALGYPDQQSSAYDCNETIKYSIDKDGKVNVPKKTLDQVLLKV